MRAEAAVTMLLRCVDEFDDGNKLCVVVCGTAVNQGGRSSTLTAPNGPSQQDVVRNALTSAALAPSAVSALQMHGTVAPHWVIPLRLEQQLPSSSRALLVIEPHSLSL